MRNLFIYSLILVFCSCESSSNDHPSRFRIEQMQMMKIEESKIIKEWPAERSGLFQLLRKRISLKVHNKKDHLKAISLIPENLLKNMKIGDTREVDGWFYTSIDYIDSTNKVSSWFQVIGTQKNESFIYFSATW